MSEKKYFWLKLQKAFYSDVRVKKIRKIAGGDTYVIIYQKLLLESIDNNCVLTIQDLEEEPTEYLSLLIDEDVDNIRVCLELLKQTKLCEVHNNEIYFTSALELIGSKTDSALRVAKHRERKLLQSNTDVTVEKQKSVTTINIELEKDIELDLNKDIKKEKEVKHKYGEYKNVLLTDKELDKLKEKFDNWNDKIKNLDEGIELRGYKYKSHYLAILKWSEKDKETESQQQKEKNDIPKRACGVCGDMVFYGVCEKCKAKTDKFGGVSYDN